MSIENPDGTGEGTPKPNEVDVIPKTEYTKLQQEKERLQTLATELSEDRESLKTKLESFGSVSAEEAKSLQEQVRAFKLQESGVDPEVFKAEWEVKETELRGEFGKVNEANQSTIQQLSSELHELRVTSKVMDQHGASINDDMRSFVKGVVAKLVDRDETTGQYQVKNDKGEVRYKAHNPGEKMTVEDLFAELETQYPSAFKAKGIKGSLNPNGQQVQGQKPSTFGNVDIERFKADEGYRQKFSSAERAQLFIKLGM